MDGVDMVDILNKRSSTNDYTLQSPHAPQSSVLLPTLVATQGGCSAEIRGNALDLHMQAQWHEEAEPELLGKAETLGTVLTWRGEEKGISYCTLGR
jgi:hypothetical protein